MITLTVNIDNKKSEKAVRAVLDALGLNYSIDEPQTVQQYNDDLEKENSEIENGNFVSAIDLKAEAGKW